MSQQPSGWYDDPSNPDMLRYWDGVMWTNHTAPKKSPTAAQSTIGLPQQSVPQAPGAPTPTTPMPQGSGWHSQAPGQYQQAPQYAPAGSASWMMGPTTVDGVPLSSWGKRVLARILDGIITSVIVAIVGWTWISQLVTWYGDLITQATESGTAPDPATMQAELTPLILPIAIVATIVALVYETAFLVARGATPGKMAVGISVRRTGTPGPLSVIDALKRQVLTVANSLLSSVPVVSSLFSIVMLLNYLWPLWDDKRQALHDKIADTQVVVGKQPPRQG